MLELVVSKGGKDLVALALDKKTVSIGRAGTNDLSIPDPTVSRHQCQIVTEGKKLRLLDHSGQGTSVDGKRVKDALLQPGAQINFGTLTGTLRERADQPRPADTLTGGGTEVLLDKQDQPEALKLVGQLKSKPLEIKLSGNVVNLGLEPTNDVVVKDSFISAFHCRFYKKSGAWFIVDLDSTNGTKVNGVRIGEAQLSAGAVVTLGKFELRVELDIDQTAPGGFHGILSEDPVMEPVFETIRRVAPTDETVLITGETGSGKELVAQAVHQLSLRSDQTLVTLNCAAITKDLLESELFGHEKGAFTGAQSRRLGLFEEADKGSLFLDEIGELGLDIQAKLLRALENGEIRRVGSNTPIRIDARVITATHQSLPSKVQSGDFRQDLYYRICVIEIAIPPLRERPKDIPLLARYFLQKATRNTGARTISKQAIESLVKYRFPGNVRELKHVITRAAILCPQDTIEASHLAFSPPTLADRVSESKIYRKGKTLQEVEVETIRQTLNAHDGNQKAAARVLGIARSTLIHKMEKYNISSKPGETNRAS
ncbi:MAG: sigma 54-interacting transcriptional regulator [Deltaproteobacteria bacterium]|nr:sigma 54-interacting transcriptional regulator [Deltaproteobacteria bacterium]